MKTTEGNKLIAEFMGYKLVRCNNGLAWESPHRYAIDDIFKIHGRLFYPKEGQYYISGNSYLKFHSSWDWLIPVVVKIFSIPFIEINGLEKYIDENLDDYSIGFHTPINVVHLKVVKFIKWYNENRKNQ